MQIIAKTKYFKMLYKYVLYFIFGHLISQRADGIWFLCNRYRNKAIYTCGLLPTNSDNIYYLGCCAFSTAAGLRGMIGFHSGKGCNDAAVANS